MRPIFGHSTRPLRLDCDPSVFNARYYNSNWTTPVYIFFSVYFLCTMSATTYSKGNIFLWSMSMFTPEPSTLANSLSYCIFVNCFIVASIWLWNVHHCQYGSHQQQTHSHSRTQTQTHLCYAYIYSVIYTNKIIKSMSIKLGFFLFSLKKIQHWKLQLNCVYFSFSSSLFF